MPDGKLVAVDLDMVDRKLSQMAVSGDLSLGPDESLDDIVRMLTGLSHASSVADLAAVINSCLPKGARLLGLFPEAAGVTIRHVLEHVTNWGDHTFDVTDSVTLDPRLHVTLDEVLAACMARGEIGSLPRIWDWGQPLVVIGSFQNYRNEAGEEGRKRHGINVVRHVTGGGTMFVEPGNYVTYSLLILGSLVEGLSLERSYKFLDQWVMGAPAEPGVMVHYMPLNDIISDKDKTVDVAQCQLASGAMLHHATMVYDVGADKALRVPWIGREKLSNKGAKSANRRVDPLHSQAQLSHDQIIDSFLKHFESCYSTRHRDYTDNEFAAAVELVEKKFATPEWTRHTS